MGTLSPAPSSTEAVVRGLIIQKWFISRGEGNWDDIGPKV